MMEFVITADGSKTLYHPEIGEHYHSRHGAVQESKHVFLGMGLRYFQHLHRAGSLSILEIGFGTGLNFLLAADYCLHQGIALDYTGVEAYPLSTTTISQMDYAGYIDAKLWDSFQLHYTNSLNAPHRICQDCMLEIIQTSALQFNTEKRYDVLYFDAFAAIHQPAMWSEETLGHVCQFLKPGGVFTTYAITGNLKRTMKGLGFTIEKVRGAPGKREMLRAINTGAPQKPKNQ